MNKLLLSLAIFLGVLAGTVITTQPNISRSLVLALISKPVELTIPALNVTAPIEYVAKNSEGAMEVPKNTDNVAWYRLGPRPGDKGNAVIAGHLDSETGAAVFAELSKLKPGDEFEVLDEAGNRKVFIVEKTRTYAENDFPLNDVFGPTDDKRLNLITCKGRFDPEEREYSDRYVVYGVLKE